MEPLLDNKNDRPSILPIKYTDIWDSYKKHESLIWHAHEVKVDLDLKKWDSLSSDEQFFLKRVLAFFASSDKIVAENLSERFSREVQIPEAKFFYGFQTMIENIHSEVYSKLIDTYIRNENEKLNLFNAIETIPCVKKKAKWANKWIESNESFATRLVAFAAVEGIFFSGSFCAIYWMNEKNSIPGLAKANDFIARDEGLHTAFACQLYTNYIVNKLSFDEIKNIIDEAVQYEIEFITDALPCKLLGMNSKQMIEYIKFCANRLVNQLGYDKIYLNVKQPFDFMDRICLREKSNFFEDEPSAYRKFADVDNEEDPYDDLF